MVAYRLAIAEAHRRGYRVQPDGSVLSPHGRVRSLNPSGLTKGSRYLAFSMRWAGSVFTIWVHRLAAYQVYGDAALADGVCVRHLDDDRNNNRPDNLALGTASDNAKDRARLVRFRDSQPC